MHATLLQGFAPSALSSVAAGSVSLVLSSPPYWFGPQDDPGIPTDALGVEETLVGYVARLAGVRAALTPLLTPRGVVALVLGEANPARETGAPQAVAAEWTGAGWTLVKHTVWQTNSSRDHLFVMSPTARPDLACRLPHRVLAPRPRRPAQYAFSVLPRKLLEPIVRVCAPPHSTVLDPFAGTGSVGAVALSLQRSFVGIEPSPIALKHARRRLASAAPSVRIGSSA